MTRYTIERVTEVDEDLENFLVETTPIIAEMFGNVFDPSNAAIRNMVTRGIFLVGKRDGEIRGIHISWLLTSPLDTQVKILQQQLFYVMPDSGRMAYHLFQKFIDIGKSQANHIITMLTKHTNVKPTTLKKLGFDELEVLFRLEV